MSAQMGLGCMGFGDPSPSVCREGPWRPAYVLNTTEKPRPPVLSSRDASMPLSVLDLLFPLKTCDMVFNVFALGSGSMSLSSSPAVSYMTGWLFAYRGRVFEFTLCANGVKWIHVTSSHMCLISGCTRSYSQWNPQ